MTHKPWQVASLLRAGMFGTPMSSPFVCQDPVSEEGCIDNFLAAEFYPMLKFSALRQLYQYKD